MKNYITKIGSICIIGLSIMACQVQETIDFQGKDVVYFELSETSALDSLGLTFAFDNTDVVDKQISLIVQVQGYPKPYDRKAQIKILTDYSTAIEGTHFEEFSKEIIVPKDSVYGKVPLSFIRIPEMREEIFRLKLKLKSNEHFETLLTGTRLSSNAEPTRPVVYDEFEFTISDILTKPRRWPTYWLGDFSVKKLYLYAEVNNIEVPDWTRSHPGLTVVYNQVSRLRNYLEAQRVAGTPVLEEDGTEMVIPEQ